jgi:hypothetical protein
MGWCSRFRINWGDQPKEGEEGGQQEGSSSILQVNGNDIIPTAAVFRKSVESIVYHAPVGTIRKKKLCEALNVFFGIANLDADLNLSTKFGLYSKKLHGLHEMVNTFVVFKARMLLYLPTYTYVPVCAICKVDAYADWLMLICLFEKCLIFYFVKEGQILKM